MCSVTVADTALMSCRLEARGFAVEAARYTTVALWTVVEWEWASGSWPWRLDVVYCGYVDYTRSIYFILFWGDGDVAERTIYIIFSS